MSNYTIEVYFGLDKKSVECPQTCGHCSYKNKNSLDSPLILSDNVRSMYGRLEDSLLSKGETITDVIFAGDNRRVSSSLPLSIDERIKNISVAFTDSLKASTIEFERYISNSSNTHDETTYFPKINFGFTGDSTPMLDANSVKEGLLNFTLAYSKSFSQICKSKVNPFLRVNMSGNHLTDTQFESFKDEALVYQNLMRNFSSLSKQNLQDSFYDDFNLAKEVNHLEIDDASGLIRGNSYFSSNGSGDVLTTSFGYRFLLQKKDYKNNLDPDEFDEENVVISLFPHGIMINHHTYDVNNKRNWISYESLSSILGTYEICNSPDGLLSLGKLLKEDFDNRIIVVNNN